MLAEPDGLAAAVERGAISRETRRRCTATGTPPDASRTPCTLDRALSATPLYDVAVIGAGYVGVPLAVTFAEAGQRALVVDVQSNTIDALNRGESHIEDVIERAARAARHERPDRRHHRLRAGQAGTRDLDRRAARRCRSQREPDLSAIEARWPRASRRCCSAARSSCSSRRRGPARRARVLQPILEQGSGLKAGEDFRLAMSPERVDPGREDWTTKTTPKVVGGIDPASTKQAADVYRAAIDTVHEVSTPDAAELTKLLENIYRAVNIALVNELAQLCDRMEIDVWEVVDAAATKPFGFASFKPGPGLGGHCIPIDPFYLTWKAREFDFSTRFIELAGEVNNNMPYFCRSMISQALNHGARKSVAGAKILILGVAYKPDIGDYRETPAEKLIHLLQERRRRRRLPRPVRAGVRRHDLVAARAGGVRLHRDRHQPLHDRLRRPRRSAAR